MSGRYVYCRTNTHICALSLVVMAVGTFFTSCHVPSKCLCLSPLSHALIASASFLPSFLFPLNPFLLSRLLFNPGFIFHVYALLSVPAEKYFDMKKNQCKDALDIYKKFLYRMTKLSEFLKVAEVKSDA